MARTWYSYVGGNPLEPSSYFRSTTKPGCLTGPSICAVYAYNGDVNPSFFSTNLQNYITNGLSTQQPQPQGGAGVKKYVYLKAGSPS